MTKFSRVWPKTTRPNNTEDAPAHSARAELRGISDAPLAQPGHCWIVNTQPEHKVTGVASAHSSTKEKKNLEQKRSTNSGSAPYNGAIIRQSHMWKAFFLGVAGNWTYNYRIKCLIGQITLAPWAYGAGDQIRV